MSDRMVKEYTQRYRKELGHIDMDTLELRVTFDGDEFVVSQIVNKIIEMAANKAVDAAMSGSHSDNGAGALIRSLKAWTCGLAGRVPGEFEKVRVAILKDTDADEYAELQRLKKKFGE